MKRQVSELLDTTANGVGMLTPAKLVELLRALDSLVPSLPDAAGDAFRDAINLAGSHLEERFLHATPIDAYRSELQRHADVAAGAMKTPPPLVVVLDTPVPGAMIVGAEDAPAPAAPRVDPLFAELGWDRNVIVITTGLLDALSPAEARIVVRHEVAHVADRPQRDRISERIDEHRDRLRPERARHPSLRAAATRWRLWPAAHPAVAAREVNWDLVEKAEQRGAEFRADRRAVEVPGDAEALRTGLEKTDALESSWLERLLPHATTRGWRFNVNGTVRTPERERTHPLTHIRAAVAARRATNRTLE